MLHYLTPAGVICQVVAPFVKMTGHPKPWELKRLVYTNRELLNWVLTGLMAHGGGEQRGSIHRAMAPCAPTLTGASAGAA